MVMKLATGSPSVMTGTTTSALCFMLRLITSNVEYVHCFDVSLRSDHIDCNIEWPL
jgi:hypothetical protein